MNFIHFELLLCNLYFIPVNAESKPSKWRRRGGGRQSSLTHRGCERCVYTPKLVLRKWVWSRLTALENSSRSGHVHFPEGPPRRHQDIFMVQHLTRPPPTTTVILPTWTWAYVDVTFSKHYLGGSVSSGSCHGGITAELRSPRDGWTASEEHRRSPSPSGKR